MRVFSALLSWLRNDQKVYGVRALKQIPPVDMDRSFDSVLFINEPDIRVSGVAFNGCTFEKCKLYAFSGSHNAAFDLNNCVLSGSEFWLLHPDRDPWNTRDKKWEQGWANRGRPLQSANAETPQPTNKL